MQALRLWGLAEARTVITDPALLSQIDTAIAYADNLLRTRQRADGGWGRSVNQASDALITAMVGIALDYSHPSPDDPQIRKTIQYLLNVEVPPPHRLVLAPVVFQQLSEQPPPLLLRGPFFRGLRHAGHEPPHQRANRLELLRQRFRRIGFAGGGARYVGPQRLQPLPQLPRRDTDVPVVALDDLEQWPPLIPRRTQLEPRLEVGERPGGLPQVHRALATAALSLPARSWASVPGANSAIRVGVIGFGGRGQDHINGMRALAGKGVRLVVLCDADAKILQAGVEAARKKGDQVNGYADMRQLFESKDVDVVTMATPNHWHALGAIWTLQAGKDAYVEKPCSHSPLEGRRLVEAARKYGRSDWRQKIRLTWEHPKEGYVIDHLTPAQLSPIFRPIGSCLSPPGNAADAIVLHR